MRLVVALGGNALLRRGEPLDAEAQRRNIEASAAALAPLAEGNELVITHGNGPQVGVLALQAEACPETGRWPLDVLGAETEGMIGYQLEQALRSALPGREVATLLTQVVVDPDDQAFLTPTKPIGPLYDEETAARLARSRHWSVAPDGAWWRRVVPSPEPHRIVELATINRLLEGETVCICVGGGGIPVVDRDGRLEGVEAVVDKDLAAALLALDLEADELVLLTDVEGIFEDWETTREGLLRDVSTVALAALALPSGSMGPKAVAASRFCTRSGRVAHIGKLEDAASVLAGRAGTTVRAGA